MKSKFQKKFKINDEFYSSEEIRDAIKKCFPYETNPHTDLSNYMGLARIVFQGRPTHADQELDFEKLIPNIKDIDIPDKLSHNFCYGIIEGTPKKADPIASTFFIPTNLGYVCDEMILNGNYRPIHDERSIPK